MIGNKVNQTNLNIMNDALRLESRETMQYCDGYKIKTVLVATRHSHQEPIQGSVPHIAGILMEKIRDNQLLHCGIFSSCCVHLVRVGRKVKIM